MAGGEGTAAAAEVTRVLVLPLARRVWLFHAGGAGAAERARRAEELRRIRGWGPRELAGRLEAFGGREVERLQAAAPGTFRGWLWKWAQALQTRIDPRETTLRGVPRRRTSVSASDTGYVTRSSGHGRGTPLR